MTNRIQRRALSRRQLLKRGGAALLGAGAVGLLAACSTATPTPAAAKPTAASQPTAAPTSEAQATATPAAQQEPAASGGSKLVIWGYQSFTPEGDTVLGDQMNAWGAANNTPVEYVVIENAVVPQKLAAAIEAQTPPDIQMFTTPTHVHLYKGRGLLLDLTDVWNAVSTQAGGFFDSVNPLFQADGKYWGIPFETDSAPMFTRLDLMEQATGRREPPKTFDELAEAARKISSPPDLYPIGLCLGRVPDTHGNMLNIIWNDGGALVNQEGTRPTLKSEGTLTAVKRVQTWWQEKLIPPDATQWDDTGNNNAYQAKQVAFAINPPSIYDWLQKNDPELLENTTMAPIPAGVAGSFGGMGAWSWSVFNATKNPDGAKALIEHLLDPDNLQQVYEKVGGRWYPVYKDLQNHDYWTSRPHFKEYPQMIQNGRFASYPAAPDANLMDALGEVQERLVIPDMIQAVVVNGEDPEKAIDDAQKAMEEIFSRRGLG